MADYAKTPAIRFAGFTDAWEQRKLGEVVKEVTRNDPTSDAPIMMITANNGFIEQSERYAFNNAGESLKKYILLEKGELAYNHGASKLRPYGSCFALTTVENARIPFVYHCFSVENHDPEFMSIELNGADVENQLRRIVSSGARMDGLLNISFEEYTSVEVLLPERAEQERISSFFRSLDNLITLHQRKYDKLMNIKKSMLEKMFPRDGANVPEIRFAGFTDAWEQRKVGELIEDYIEKTNIQNQYPVLTSSQQQGIVFQEDYFADRQVTTNENIGYYVLPYGYFTYRSRSDTDVFVFNRNSLIDKGIISYYYPVFSAKGCDSNFLLRRLNHGIKKQLSMAAEGTGQKVLAHNKFKNMVVDVPSVNEQALIGQLFESLDNLITLHQRELEKLRNIKQSCLEKMFV